MTNPTSTNSNNTSTSTIYPHTYVKETSIYIALSSIFFLFLNPSIVIKHNYIKATYLDNNNNIYEFNEHSIIYIIFIIVATSYFIGRSQKLKKNSNEIDNVDDNYKKQIEARVIAITVLNSITLSVHLFIIYLVISKYTKIENHNIQETDI